MFGSLTLHTALLTLPLTPLPAQELTPPPQGIPGEVRYDAAALPGLIESMDEVARRAAASEIGPAPRSSKMRGPEDRGVWIVPSRRETYHPHSGEHYATVKWGDPRIGLGFGGAVDLEGAWIAGQGTPGAWTSGLTVVGYRDGVEVARRGPFTAIGAEPAWFAMDLAGVDRVELRAVAAYNGAGFFGLDDLTFARGAERVVVDFEDLDWRARLTGSGHAGLVWETGHGDFTSTSVVHPPKAPVGLEEHSAEDDGTAGGTLGLGAGSATPPALLDDFRGPRMSDNGAGWLPPDTAGAAGTTHFVAVVNQHISVYDKATGSRLLNSSLGNFFNAGGSSGDPRIAFDEHAGRWIVIAGNFSTGVRFAWSLTDDAMGSWLKTFITFSQGSDTNRWPDYPTLGVDANGIYMAAYMVGSGSPMSIFAVDKAPLLQPTPSIGAVSAWRDLPWEGAIQPCVTHGSAAGEYLVSRRGSSQIRIRRIDTPLSNPTLIEVGNANVPNHSNPPSVPAQGSTVNLSTVDKRLMNAVYRDGSIWTAHTVNSGGRAACRWYELDPIAVNDVQTGTVGDPVRHYFFPALAVNADGVVVMGMSGAHAGEYAGTWFTGRALGDPAGVMADPVVYHAGEGAYNQADTGTNRWGDYSMSAADPVDGSIWTIQEHARGNGTWGTRIARFGAGCSEPINFCATSPNSVGSGAVMSWSGSSRQSNNDFVLNVIGCPPSTVGIFYGGQQETLSPFGNGLNCVGGSVVRFGAQVADALGGVVFPFDFGAYPGNQMSVDETWYFQFWYRNPAGGGAGFNTSDGAAVTWCQ